MLMFINYVRTNTYAYPSTLEQWKRTPILHSNSVIHNTNDTIVINNQYLDFFYQSIMTILEINNYKIINKNEFKKELDNFIYTLSDSERHG